MIILVNKSEMYELETLEQVTNVIENIYNYEKRSMDEILSEIEIGGLTIEVIARLYMDLRNYAGETISMIDEEGNFVL